MIQKVSEIQELFKSHFGVDPKELLPLPPSGSNRSYYRLKSDAHSAIAAYNPDKAENEAFLYITNKLKASGIHVPEILEVEPQHDIYLIEDLGNEMLFDRVTSLRAEGSSSYLELYKRVIEQMPGIQYSASHDFDYSICFPREEFDLQSIMWDLNYFKYYYLKLVYIPFHEQKLEDDFRKLADFLLEAPNDFFLFRDFQSRNIMVKEEELYFIDYQGGRRGALQYDLASLLFEAKMNLSDEERNELLDYYLEMFSKYSFFDEAVFLKYYAAYVLIRQLQAFGAYGYRGYFEKKSFFLKSIPFGLKNVAYILKEMDLGVEIPHLREVLLKMTNQTPISIPETVPGKLNLRINSFSYKKKFPEDYSGNGGGFVFDCRNLPNPGRYEEYKMKTGKDAAVIEFLEKREKVGDFLNNANALITAAVKDYIDRGFEHLMVSFGCTGGQHRSVYCAEQFYKYFTNQGKVSVTLNHYELPKI